MPASEEAPETASDEPKSGELLRHYKDTQANTAPVQIQG
jgi:hypothetical protein